MDSFMPQFEVLSGVVICFKHGSDFQKIDKYFDQFVAYFQWLAVTWNTS